MPYFKPFRLDICALICRVVALTLAGTLGSGTALAGKISTPDLNNVFVKAPTVTVKWLDAGTTIYDKDLAAIDSQDEMNTLFGKAPDKEKDKIVDVFFVDAVNWCSGPGASFNGCAPDKAAYTFVVDSLSAANDLFGNIVIAHELGHNLGLNHIDNPPLNLMNPKVDESLSLELNDEQYKKIWDSTLVQTATDGSRFINLRPIEVSVPVGNAPEPETYAMLLAGLGLLGFIARRRKQKEAAGA